MVSELLDISRIVGQYYNIQGLHENRVSRKNVLCRYGWPLLAMFGAISGGKIPPFVGDTVSILVP